jgi:hypothetical protein
MPEVGSIVLCGWIKQEQNVEKPVILEFLDLDLANALQYRITRNKAPEILNEIPQSGSYLKKGVTESPLLVYLNEPAQCKYEKYPGVLYEDMSMEMDCDSEIDEEASYIEEWLCGAQLTGLDQPENKIYIKCNDSSGNVMLDDEIYTLLATQEDLVRLGLDHPPPAAPVPEAPATHVGDATRTRTSSGSRSSLGSRPTTTTLSFCRHASMRRSAKFI